MSKIDTSRVIKQHGKLHVEAAVDEGSEIATSLVIEQCGML